MIQALLIDDELHCINRISALLEKNHAKNISIIGTSCNIKDALEKINKMSPDVLFLDIQIGNDTGFELLEKISDRDINIIFTTAYNQYAVHAFKCMAIDYLLKPIDADDLYQSVQKLTNKYEKENITKKMDLLLQNISIKDHQEKTLAIPTINGYDFVKVSDIMRCDSNINYTTIFLISGKKITVAKTLKEFEEILSFAGFFRVHNSHLINMVYMQSYNKGKTGKIKLSDGSEVDVSSRRRNTFLEKIMLV